MIFKPLMMTFFVKKKMHLINYYENMFFFKNHSVLFEICVLCVPNFLCLKLK